jgi:antitoxin YefM
MKSTYSVTEAQAGLPKILRQSEDRIVTIERHGATAAFIVSRERMEAIAETMELLANRDFMDIVRKYRAGTLEMKPLSALR